MVSFLQAIISLSDTILTCYVFFTAKGNQGSKGFHPTDEEWTQTPSQRKQNLHQEKQEEQRDKVQVTHTSLLVHSHRERPWSRQQNHSERASLRQEAWS